MKIKQTIYLLLILMGAAVMAGGEQIVRKEYAYSIGLILLMFGIYKTTQLFSLPGTKEDEDSQE